jgi:hypothetical protein
MSRTDAAASVVVDPAATPGAVAFAGVVAFQRATASPPMPAKVTGIRQTVLGLVVVAVTATGLHLA